MCAAFGMAGWFVASLHLSTHSSALVVDRKLHRERENENARNRTWDLLNTSQMLLPLTFWTHGMVVDNFLSLGVLNATLSFLGFQCALCLAHSHPG